MFENPILYPINRKTREKIKVAVNNPVKYENKILVWFDAKSDEFFIATCLSLCTP
jgi:hypothetical protein